MKDLKTCVATFTILFALIAGSSCQAATNGKASSHGRASSIAATTSLYRVVTQDTKADAETQKQLIVQCPPKMIALAAGWSVLDPKDAVLEGRVTNFVPSADGSSWTVDAQNNSIVAPNWKLRVRLICVPI
jgi:hypothetical protein